MSKIRKAREVSKSKNSTSISEIFSTSGYTITKTFSRGEDLLEYVKGVPEPELLPDIFVTDLNKRSGKAKKSEIKVIVGN